MPTDKVVKPEAAVDEFLDQVVAIEVIQQHPRVIHADVLENSVVVDVGSGVQAELPQ